jgi:serine/threonine protein kinase
VLQRLRPSANQHLANLVALHEGPTALHLVLEYCDGMSLQRQLQKHGVGSGMEERRTAPLVRQLCAGLAHVHSLGIAHRDLKPSNVVFISSADGSPRVKMVDFGFAIHCGGERCHTKCGTPIYMAPEQNKAAPSYFGQPVDCWALGAMLYEMLAGRPAFNGAGLAQIAQRIRTGSFEPWNTRAPVSTEAKGVVKWILNPDPTQRPSMQQIVEDPWVRQPE